MAKSILFYDENSKKYYNFDPTSGSYIQIQKFDPTARPEKDSDWQDIEDEKSRASEIENDEKHGLKQLDNADPEELKKFYRSMSNDELDNLFGNNEKIKADKERQAKINKAAKERVSKVGIDNGTMKQFKQCIEDMAETYDEDEYDYEYKRTYSKPNRRNNAFNSDTPVYKGTSVTKKLLGNESTPSVNVYYDCSGSFDHNDVNACDRALAALFELEERDLIKVNIYYFNRTLCSSFSEARGQCNYPGQNLCRSELIWHMMTYKPDNVIIMTDRDTDWDSDDFVEMFDGVERNQNIRTAPVYACSGKAIFILRKGYRRGVERADVLMQHIYAENGTDSFVLNT